MTHECSTCGATFRTASGLGLHHWHSRRRGGCHRSCAQICADVIAACNSWANGDGTDAGAAATLRKIAGWFETPF